MTIPTDTQRRPIKTREQTWAKNSAKWLAQKRVSPNHISLASIGFAGLACVAFYLLGHQSASQ